MGKISVTRVYHVGLPVNDIKRAEKFYVDVLGMAVMGRGSSLSRVLDTSSNWTSRSRWRG